ncbi:MAG: PAC2 family protein [Candidatus Thorarchaeota archaeon]
MNSYYPETFTKIITEHKLKGGILIQCFPGQGLVGRIAGMQLIDYFNAKESAKIYSSFFPHLVIFNGEIGKLIHAEIYVIESTNPPLMIVTGESQPQEDPKGMFQVLNSTLDLAQKWGVTSVIAIGGFRPSNVKGTPETNGFAYTEEDTQKLKDNDIALFTEGRVSGAVGVITALAAERGMSSYGLMGKVRQSETPTMAFGVDPQAAKNVLKTVVKLTGIEIDLSKMDKMIKEIEQTEANAMKVIEDLTKDQEGSDRKNYYI